jgi:serine/threonine protein kinase
MTPERWKRIEELYHESRARAPGERAAFLAKSCPDDEALRREVLAILNDTDADGFLVTPVPGTRSPLTSALSQITMSGRTLGTYQLQALVGAGGMGEVYRAHDAKLGRDVAIKILPPAFTSDPDRLARFEREARMLAALNHPNICAIYGIEMAEGIQFLVLELVEGETLTETLAKVSRMPGGGAGLAPDQALTIARQLAEALEIAHERGGP